MAISGLCEYGICKILFCVFLLSACGLPRALENNPFNTSKIYGDVFQNEEKNVLSHIHLALLDLLKLPKCSFKKEKNTLNTI